MLMQTRFSGQSEYIIKKQYAISADEKIICGIWIHLRRKGFVFTDKGFYWNLPTSIINAAGKQEVTVPSNILTENSGRLKVAILHKENQSHTNHSVEFLQFSTDMGRVQIKLEPITTDDASILRRIFIEYAARGKFPYDNLKQSPLENSFLPILVSGPWRSISYTDYSGILCQDLAYTALWGPIMSSCYPV